MDGDALRRNLEELLRGGLAHADAASVLADLDPALRSVRPARGLPSVYEELAHMRIAQEDILRYTLDPSWRSPAWPSGYWPSPAADVSDEEWEREVARFSGDLEEVIRLVRDTKVDLTAPLPHGEDRTYLRQVLLVADHNSYHAGQIVKTRKMLAGWAR